jgi:hypothetical protein
MKERTRNNKISERDMIQDRWFVEIVRWGLKVRCIAKSTQTFRPEDGHPASLYNE